MSQSIKKDIVSYFKSDQWKLLLKLLKKKHHEEVYHAHIFVDTCLHPNTLRKILFIYFESIEMPLDRPIDYQVSNVGNIMAHNIHPENAFHFDLAFRYKPKVVLKAMPNKDAFRGSNLQFWGKKETYDFIDHFPFLKNSKKNEVRIEEYFYSSDFRICTIWSEYKYFTLDRRMVHFHANVETSFHPDLIKKVTLKMIEREGWDIHLAVHCLFYPNKNWKAGKICFLLSDPMFNFDIAWDYNPDVLIRPSRKFFVQQIRPDFDLRYGESENDLLKLGKFLPEFTNEELEELKIEFLKLK